MANRKHTALAAMALMTAIGAATVAIAADPPGMAAALADPARPDVDKARDVDRKPAEMIAFAGVKRGDIVAELAPGGGYYTRLLSATVGPNGKIYAFSGRPASPAMQAVIASHANLVFALDQTGEIAVPQPVDVVWTTLNYHDFANGKAPDGRSVAAVTNAAAFKALKPGGVYLVNDHAARADAAMDSTSVLHRISPERVKREVEAAGFKLDASSAMLANPADDITKPSGEGGRRKTDQFVLRFRKPA